MSVDVSGCQWMSVDVSESHPVPVILCSRDVDCGCLVTAPSVSTEQQAGRRGPHRRSLIVLTFMALCTSLLDFVATIKRDLNFSNYLGGFHPGQYRNTTDWSRHLV